MKLRDSRDTNMLLSSSLQVVILLSSPPPLSCDLFMCLLINFGPTRTGRISFISLAYNQICQIKPYRPFRLNSCRRRSLSLLALRRTWNWNWGWNWNEINEDTLRETCCCCCCRCSCSCFSLRPRNNQHQPLGLERNPNEAGAQLELSTKNSPFRTKWHSSDLLYCPANSGQLHSQTFRLIYLASGEEAPLALGVLAEGKNQKQKLH